MRNRTAAKQRRKALFVIVFFLREANALSIPGQNNCGSQVWPVGPGANHIKTPPGMFIEPMSYKLLMFSEPAELLEPQPLAWAEINRGVPRSNLCGKKAAVAVSHLGRWRL